VRSHWQRASTHCRPIEHWALRLHSGITSLGKRQMRIASHTDVVPSTIWHSESIPVRAQEMRHTPSTQLEFGPHALVGQNGTGRRSSTRHAP
jgi:hypothetical protein